MMPHVVVIAQSVPDGLAPAGGCAHSNWQASATPMQSEDRGRHTGWLLPSSHSYCVAGSHRQPPSAPAPLELSPPPSALCDALALLPLPPSDVLSGETLVEGEGPLEEHAATRRHGNQLNCTMIRIGNSLQYCQSNVDVWPPGLESETTKEQLGSPGPNSPYHGCAGVVFT
jgi:hypothetical protein